MKLTDITPYSEMGEPTYHKYLEFVGKNAKNVSGKSNKFWEVAVFKRGGVFLTVRRWGKFGSKGQIKEEVFMGSWTAEMAAQKVEEKKRAKGYTKEIDVVTRLSTLVDE